MRILIDTHILIWHLEDDVQLSSYYGQLIEDRSNTVFVSIVSFWEIAINTSRGKLSLSKPIVDIVAQIERSTISILPINPRHTIQVSHLPFHHKDPFDRMIIAQALVDDLPVISSDRNFTNYGVELL